MFTVRFATLADAHDISLIHRSDIQEWYKGCFDSEGIRHREPATWEECSLIDRFEMGGAWMSPELCAIHLNRLLLDDQVSLVAEIDNHVVGELELFCGPDDLYGNNANLSVFYVHRDWRGQGIGTALLQDAIMLVREMGSATMTTYDPEIPEYYQRQGLEADRRQWLVVLPCQDVAPCMYYRNSTLPSFETISKLKLLCGRVLSSYQLYWLLAEETFPGSYAIPAAWRRKDYSYNIGKGEKRSFVVFRDRSGRGTWAAVHLWGMEMTRDLVATVVSLGRKLGFAALHFIVDAHNIPVFDAFRHDEPREATSIHCLKL